MEDSLGLTCWKIPEINILLINCYKYPKLNINQFIDTLSFNSKETVLCEFCVDCIGIYLLFQKPKVQGVEGGQG